MRKAYWVVAVREPTKNEAEDGVESEIVNLGDQRFTVVMADSAVEAVTTASNGVTLPKRVKLRAGPLDG